MADVTRNVNCMRDRGFAFVDRSKKKFKIENKYIYTLPSQLQYSYYPSVRFKNRKFINV